MSPDKRPVRRAVIVAARRTAVCPRGGALAHLQADELAAPVLRQLLSDADLAPDAVDQVLLGNALYGGGNPARLAALRAGLPASVPAMTIDTQCCSGLDAILQGARMIESGAAECVLAGGAESFSRAPIRMHRPETAEGRPVAYDRPSFAPPPFGDPDLTEAAACLADRLGVARTAQADFAVTSHSKADAAMPAIGKRLVRPDAGAPDRDGFTRPLTRKTVLRAPVLAGGADAGLNAATIACEADGAAAVLILSEEAWAKRGGGPCLNIRQGVSVGGDPADPALVPIEAVRQLLNDQGVAVRHLAAVELMEAYAVQAQVTMAELGLDPARMNRLGGALARGHPIGASGAILVVQLFQSLGSQESAAESGERLGLALIAAAGGLGTAMLFESAVSKGG
ncbi:thiolase family protein [Roseibium sp.]|uniref:thiolase family protein n=1 Tax=Roseibium sp. TaxID=1936156 RepID=UPI003BB11728